MIRLGHRDPNPISDLDLDSSILGFRQAAGGWNSTLRCSFRATDLVGHTCGCDASALHYSMCPKSPTQDFITCLLPIAQRSRCHSGCFPCLLAPLAPPCLLSVPSPLVGAIRGPSVAPSAWVCPICGRPVPLYSKALVSATDRGYVDGDSPLSLIVACPAGDKRRTPPSPPKLLLSLESLFGVCAFPYCPSHLVGSRGGLPVRPTDGRSCQEGGLHPVACRTHRRHFTRSSLAEAIG